MSEHAQSVGSTRQRSFRLLERTLRLLDRRSQELGQSSNAIAQRLIDESLRTDRHPLISFRPSGTTRRPALVGTRLFVWQVINTLREGENDVAEAAEYLGITEAQIRACVSYYAEFRDEVDNDVEQEAEFAEREQERWRSEQEVLG